MKPVLILQNDPVVPPGTIAGYFQTRSLPSEVLLTYEVETFPTISDYRAIISLGSTASANDYLDQPHLKKLYNYLQKIADADHPYLGICFSSQLMAMVLGAEVRVNPVKEIGTSTINLAESGLADRLFEGFDSELSVFQWHTDSFDLPKSATLLASSAKCSHQAYRHGKLVGLQFHPEVDRWIAENWSGSFKVDLYMTNQTRGQLLANYEPIEAQLKEINYRLLDNFLATCPE